MSTTAMWLLLAVVVVAIVFGSVLYKRTFTTKELALTGVMAALSLVAYLFFRVPAGRAPVRISPARLRYSCSYSGTPEPGSSAVVKWTMIVSSSFCRMPNWPHKKTLFWVFS